jgi:hypothetical protein
VALKDQRKSARRRSLIEALALFVFAWLAAIVTSLLRPPPIHHLANFEFLPFLGSTFESGLEIFVFGYVLSRFFKQFRTGCAVVMILFLAYLIWAGRHPR